MADKTEPVPYKTGPEETDPYKTEPEKTGPDETSDTKLLEEKEDSIEDFTEEEDTSTLVVKEKEQEADENERKLGSEPKFRLYRWRWFMLATLLLLNISNGTMWLTFAPIPDYSAAFYGVSRSEVDWFSVAFFVVSVAMGFVGIFILDTWGLKISLYLGAGFNLGGSVLRCISSAHPVVCSSVYGKSGYLVAMLGQILSACAQPFLLYSPTKLAGVWFGPKERATCTNLASLGNTLGLAAALLVSPNIVTTTQRLPTLIWVYTIPAAVGAALAVVAFWWNRPPIPPSLSAQQKSQPFFKGLMKVVTNCSFWVLLMVWGTAAGMFNALLTLLAQVICPHGYSDKDSGLWGALMNFCGLVGAVIGGLILDYTKLFKEFAVVCMGIANLCLIWFIEVSRLPGQSVNIAFSLCIFGFFGMPLIAAFLEVGVEITYPVAEATSSGLLWIAAQLMGTVLVLIGQALETDIPPELLPQSQCSVEDVAGLPCFDINDNSSIQNSTSLNPREPKDLTNAGLFYAGLVSLNFLFFVLAFRPSYKRLKVERIAKKLKQLKEEPSTLESNHHDVIGLQNLGSSTDSSPPVTLEEEESRL